MASPLVAGEPPINFAAHQIRAGNIAGARDDFEQMLAVLIGAIYPGARAIAANPGDWGIDILLGELSGLVVIWQSKYFWPSVTRSAQAQIRDSFDSALASAERNGYQVAQWVLCVPSSMDPATARWWDRWRARRQRETGVVIELWHEATLREMLLRPDAAHVRRHYYDPYFGGPAPRSTPRSAPRSALRDVDDGTAADLERALFVRQLRAAGHEEVGSAKREFFNAELLVREILDKRVPAEVSALSEADGVAYGIWEARFNAVAQAHPADPLLPGLHAAVVGEIRESGAFPVGLRAGPVHHCGLMHRIVQDGRAGWVRHWRRIAEESPV
ncbi:serine/threonine protein kinase [Cryptosporangium phraense]|uniref:Serine/threonine protein kinase n=1 Tax=Cryptosporangium phraense TaxID=2593070 RepID=A0A545AFA5_9ACTN|nr:serine/threonine protein kinase [Cryptosporangium phraense]TQS40016.1 serine/threonine protein kinase [Cryptosporangium phraense]